MYEYPFGNGQQLNLDWFLNEWKNLLAAWEAEKNGIEGALQAEIDRAEAALADVLAARDAAAQSAANALESKNAAAQSASDASGYLATVRADANTAHNAAQNAAQSESNAAESAQTALASKNTAANSERNAAQSEANALTSKNAAAQSASAAADSQTAAGNSASAAADSQTAAGNSASAAAQSAEDAGAAAASVEGSAQQIVNNTSDINNLKESFNEITKTVEPTEYAIVSSEYEWGIQQDMEVTYNNENVTFSYPYASGNKTNFGLWFPDLVNGKTYVATFDITSGNIDSASIVRLTGSFQAKNLIVNFTKSGNTFNCEFVADLKGDIAYNGLRLNMLRSISTTVTISNISVKEKNATNKLVVNSDNISQFPTNPCDYKGTEITLFHKIICVGDSLTQGVCNYVYQGATHINTSFPNYAYPTFLKKLTGCNITNAGEAGATFETWYANHSIDDLSGHDAAIIQLGANNASDGWTQEAETALANIISKLQTENKGIKIFVATIIPAFAYSGNRYDAISTGIREFIEELDDTNVILLDMAEYGHTADETSYNNGHLTAIGYLKLAKDYIAYISNIIAINSISFRFVQFIGTDYKP